MSKIKRALLITGGGAWSAYAIGTLARLNNNYDIVIGVSTGTLLAPFIALNEWDIIKNILININNNNIFDNIIPLSENGKIKIFPIILALLFGYRTISTTNNLKKNIDKIFDEKYFIDLQKHNKDVIIGVQNFAQIPSRMHFFNVKNENFEDFKDWMWYGANYPLFTSLIKKTWKDNKGNQHIGLWGDGSLINLSGLNQLLNKNVDIIDIIIFRIKDIKQYEGNKITNLIDNINVNIDSIRYNIENEYLYEIIKKLNMKGITVNIYWLPRPFNKNQMFFNKNQILNLWNEGYETAFDLNQIETFKSTKK